ncbi:MAG: hypothetical protein ACKPAH_12010 [Verrucomicrobiota bacterium]
MKRALTLLLLLLIGAGCASTPSHRAWVHRPGPFIAVMAAYPPEIEANEAVFGGPGATRSTWHIDGLVFRHVRFAGHDLLLFPSGVSMVNAAMNTRGPSTGSAFPTCSSPESPGPSTPGTASATS